MLSGVIDQETPHHRGSDREKLGAILPDDPALAGEPKIRLVYEGGWPERVIRTLTGEVPAGLTP
jgi:hypothetical protein